MAKDNFGDWLIKQPHSFIVETLGSDKAALFIRGEIDVPRFKDTTGKSYTIDEMRILEAQSLAFDEH